LIVFHVENPRAIPYVENPGAIPYRVVLTRGGTGNIMEDYMCSGWGW